MVDTTKQHTRQDEDRIWTSANIVTFVRILLIPLFVIVILSPWPDYLPTWTNAQSWKPWASAAVFIIISCTDFLDGYLARSRGEVTTFGKFMDPLADKILVTAALLALIELGVLPSWIALIIIAREFIVSGVRMLAANNGEVIAASLYGKAKTVFQIIAIVLFIIKDSNMIEDFNPMLSAILYGVSWAVMGIAIVLTIISLFDYLSKARHLFGLQRKRGTDQAAADVTPTRRSLDVLASQVIDAARERGVLVATAESCTGGLIGGALTSIAGSSDVVAGGVISYTNDVKQALLGVSASDLASVGAVSEEVACQMAEGARKATGADVAVSVTGIAGPGGAVPGKPVGTVWIGFADAQGAQAQEHHFSGNRTEVRMKTVEMALRRLLQYVES